MMKAVVYSAYGKLEEVLQLKEVPKPKANANDILVKVKAVSINPVDVKRAKGYLSLFMKKLPYTPCEDISGIVEEVGTNVKRFKVGDQIVAKLVVAEGGGLAEYAALNEDLAIPKPSNVSFEEAAAFPLAGLTSYQALLKGGIRSGKRVLIAGGSGGCGSFGIQIAKSFGATVVATCSTRNVELVRGFGADQVIDYTNEDWSQVLKDDKVDIIYDTVGGAWPKAHHVLKSGGRFLAIAEGSGEKMTLSSALSLGGTIFSRKFRSVFGNPSYDLIMTTENLRQLEALGKLVEEGKLRPHIDTVFNLEQFKEAFQLSESGRVRGKVIFKIGSDE